MHCLAGSPWLEGEKLLHKPCLSPAPGWCTITTTTTHHHPRPSNPSRLRQVGAGRAGEDVQQGRLAPQEDNVGPGGERPAPEGSLKGLQPGSVASAGRREKRRQHVGCWRGVLEQEVNRLHWKPAISRTSPAPLRG